MSRGRPSEQIEIRTKWTEEYIEFPSKPELGTKSLWHYDTNKFKNGPFKTEIFYPKGYKSPKIKIDKKSYQKQPVAIVFNTSNRSNAKTKIKIWRNTNIDYVLSMDKIPGIPSTAIILECGVGEGIINSYKLKYNL
tara:strand:+ start:521 stop:928 length:408 start_codon:yes stop_codon:yes gene_type:complete